MLIFYIKLALRNFKKYPSSTIINLLGLSTGTAAFLFIFHYTYFHFSFDNFHPQVDNIVSVWSERHVKGELQYRSSFTFPGVGPASVATIPEVINYTRLYEARNNPIITNVDDAIQFNEAGNVYFTDPTIFSLFDIEIVKGNESNALQKPEEVYLSETTAKKYFGTSDAIGKAVKLQDSAGFKYMATVTGIFKDMPNNTHLQLDFLFSNLTLSHNFYFERDWRDLRFFTYLLLQEGTSIREIQNKITSLAKEKTSEDLVKMGVEQNLHLLPLKDIHFTTDLENPIAQGVNKRFIEIFMLIGILILCIAWVNYTNMATAKVSERAAEVAIKKVIGASKLGLLKQFLTEAALINICGIIGGVAIFGIITIFLPQYSHFLDLNFNVLLYWFLPFTIIATFIAGIYPAWLLTSFKPAGILKNNNSKRSQGNLLRSLLVSAQFAVTLFLLIATLTVLYQTKNMELQPLGFTIEEKLVVKPPSVIEAEKGKSRYSTYIPRAIAFKESLLAIDGVSSVTESGRIPGEAFKWKPNYIGLSATNNQTTQSCTGIDRYFWDTYQIPLVAGRNFTENSEQKMEVIINETSAKLLGFQSSEEAIGVTLYSPVNDPSRKGNIIGVVADYHHESLQKAIEPIVFIHRPATWEPFTIQLNTSNYKQVLAEIEENWQNYFPDNPFDFFFLDAFYNQQYEQEKQYSNMLMAFSGLSVLIACLGLYGMVSYNVLLKRKEIGIRKVLGASISEILILLSKKYFQLLFIAILISVPIANYFMQEWLTQFAYKVEIKWWLFLIPILITLLLAAFTLSGQSIKAALAKPVNSLKET